MSRNFDHPYRADSLRDFWRRWHISLTRWFTDYVYIPLGGSRRGTARLAVNTMVVFLLSGLWHGAALHFVVWGGVHGELLLLEKALTPCGGNHKARTRTPCAYATPIHFLWSASLGSFSGQPLSRMPSAAVPPACRLVAEHTAHNAAEHRYTAGGRACFGGALPASAARNVVRSTVPAQLLAFCLLALTVVAAWFSTLHTGTTNAFIYFQF